MLASLVVTAVAVSLTGACGGGGEDGGEAGGAESPPVAFGTSPTGALNAWAFDNADDVGKARLEHAKQQLSGVTVTLDATPFDAQKFTTRAASGEVPDVVQMDRNYVATYAAKGLIKPLDGCYTAQGVDAKAQFYPSVIADVTYGDKVWAVPQFYQPPAIMVNKRVLESAGVTAADLDTSRPDVLVAALTKMTKASGGNPTTIGLDIQPTGQANLWMLGLGGKLVGEDGAPTLDDPNNAKVLAVMKQLTDAQGGYAKLKSFTDSFDTFGGKNQFVKDQVGAQIMPQWFVNVLTPYADDVDISAVPFKDASGQPFTVAGGSAFVIPENAKNPDAACAWVLDLTSQDSWLAAGAARAKTIANTKSGVNTGLFTGSPAADQAIRSQYVKPSSNPGFDETIATYYDVVDKGRSIGASPAGQQLQTELQNAIVSVLLGTKEPDAALKDAQSSAMRAYNQAR